MKRLQYFLSLCLLGIAYTLLSSFRGEVATGLIERFAPPGTAYRYTFAADTITNSEDDTLYMPSSWGSAVSRFTYCWDVQKTQLSGTLNVGFILQETNEVGASATSSSWITRDSLSGGATGTAGRAVGDEIYGMRQRIVAQGRGATQSGRYILRVTIKQKK